MKKQAKKRAPKSPKKSSTTQTNPKNTNPSSFNFIRCSDGAEYFGQLFPQTNTKSGIGVLKLTPNLRYEGQFQSDKFNGVGSMTSGPHSNFIGQMKNGARSGVGRSIQADTEYTGEYRNGKIDGIGILLNKKTQKVHKGQFFAGTLNGFGVIESTEISLSDGRPSHSFQGYFKRGVKEGPGVEKTNDLIFYGNYKNSQKQGMGAIKGPDGQLRFIGRYHKGAKNGFCHFVVKKGHYYKGNLTAGARNGVGLMVNRDQGFVYLGEFRGDLRAGFGKVETLGYTYIGDWRDGMMDGVGLVVYKTAEGRGYFGQWARGRKHGYGYEFDGGDEAVRRLKKLCAEKGVVGGDGAVEGGEAWNGLNGGRGLGGSQKLVFKGDGAGSPWLESLEPKLGGSRAKKAFTLAMYQFGDKVRVVKPETLGMALRRELDLSEFDIRTEDDLKLFEGYINEQDAALDFDTKKIEDPILEDRKVFKLRMKQIEMSFKGIKSKFDSVQLELLEAIKQAGMETLLFMTGRGKPGEVSQPSQKLNGTTQMVKAPDAARWARDEKKYGMTQRARTGGGGGGDVDIKPYSRHSPALNRRGKGDQGGMLLLRSSGTFGDLGAPEGIRGQNGGVIGRRGTPGKGGRGFNARSKSPRPPDQIGEIQGFCSPYKKKDGASSQDRVLNDGLGRDQGGLRVSDFENQLKNQKVQFDPKTQFNQDFGEIEDSQGLNPPIQDNNSLVQPITISPEPRFSRKPRFGLDDNQPNFRRPDGHPTPIQLSSGDQYSPSQPIPPKTKKNHKNPNPQKFNQGGSYTHQRDLSAGPPSLDTNRPAIKTPESPREPHGHISTNPDRGLINNHIPDNQNKSKGPGRQNDDIFSLKDLLVETTPAHSSIGDHQAFENSKHLDDYIEDKGYGRLQTYSFKPDSDEHPLKFQLVRPNSGQKTDKAIRVHLGDPEPGSVQDSSLGVGDPIGETLDHQNLSTFIYNYLSGSQSNQRGDMTMADLEYSLERDMSMITTPDLVSRNGDVSGDLGDRGDPAHCGSAVESPQKHLGRRRVPKEVDRADGPIDGQGGLNGADLDESNLGNPKQGKVDGVGPKNGKKKKIDKKELQRKKKELMNQIAQIQMMLNQAESTDALEPVQPTAAKDSNNNNIFHNLESDPERPEQLKNEKKEADLAPISVFVDDPYNPDQGDPEDSEAMRDREEEDSLDPEKENLFRKKKGSSGLPPTSPPRKIEIELASDGDDPLPPPPPDLDQSDKTLLKIPPREQYSSRDVFDAQNPHRETAPIQIPIPDPNPHRELQSDPDYPEQGQESPPTHNQSPNPFNDENNDSVDPQNQINSIDSPYPDNSIQPVEIDPQQPKKKSNHLSKSQPTVLDKKQPNSPKTSRDEGFLNNNSNNNQNSSFGNPYSSNSQAGLEEEYGDAGGSQNPSQSSGSIAQKAKDLMAAELTIPDDSGIQNVDWSELDEEPLPQVFNKTKKSQKPKRPTPRQSQRKRNFGGRQEPVRDPKREEIIKKRKKKLRKKQLQVEKLRKLVEENTRRFKDEEDRLQRIIDQQSESGSRSIPESPTSDSKTEKKFTRARAKRLKSTPSGSEPSEEKENQYSHSSSQRKDSGHPQELERLRKEKEGVRRSLEQVNQKNRDLDARISDLEQKNLKKRQEIAALKEKKNKENKNPDPGSEDPTEEKHGEKKLRELADEYQRLKTIDSELRSERDAKLRELKDLKAGKKAAETGDKADEDMSFFIRKVDKLKRTVGSLQSEINGLEKQRSELLDQKRDDDEARKYLDRQRAKVLEGEKQLRRKRRRLQRLRNKQQ